MKNVIKLLPFLLLISACNKEATDFTDTPVIESYLSPGNYFSVAISRQTPFSSNVPFSSDSINTLSITLVYNGVPHTLIPLGSGRYGDSSIVIAENDSFDLSFSFNAKTVHAATSVPSKPIDFTKSDSVMYIPPTGGNTVGQPTSTVDITPINLVWNNTDGSYYLLLVTMIDPNPLPIDTSGEIRAPKSFRKPPTISNSEALRSGDFQYYGLYQVVLYHVHTDYAALYAQTSNSSLNLTNPSTNVENGYGIFTGMSSDTLYMRVARP